MSAMKHVKTCPARGKGLTSGRWVPAVFLALMLLPSSARAGLLAGETLDTVADVLCWIVLVIAPIVGIAVFLLIHILPEKIAERRQHPQAKAIQCLCLLSLVFGGLLWPLAWLWAYSKPVLYKLAYGTDKVAHGHDETAPATEQPETEEVRQLRKRVAELETRLRDKTGTEGGRPDLWKSCYWAFTRSSSGWSSSSSNGCHGISSPRSSPSPSRWSG